MPLQVKRRSPEALKKLDEKLLAISKKEVAVGFPAGQAQDYPDGENLVEVVFKNIRGIGCPQRDFMSLGEVFIKRNEDIDKAMKGAAKTGEESLMKAAGQLAADDIRSAIMDGDWEPNSSETIERKGPDSRPLIDTSHMKNNVSYVIRNKSSQR